MIMIMFKIIFQTHKEGSIFDELWSGSEAWGSLVMSKLPGSQKIILKGRLQKNMLNWAKRRTNNKNNISKFVGHR